MLRGEDTRPHIFSTSLHVERERVCVEKTLENYFMENKQRKAISHSIQKKVRANKLIINKQPSLIHSGSSCYHQLSCQDALSLGSFIMIPTESSFAMKHMISLPLELNPKKNTAKIIIIIITMLAT